MEIIIYNGALDIDVKFLDETIRHKLTYQQFRNGTIINPMYPTVCGKGFLGIGTYNIYTKERKIRKCYQHWHSMIHRCYNDNYNKKEPTYKEITVCDEWHNYQNFADWYDKNYYEVPNEKMQLDKDILYKGNKVYSPNTCVFVPQTINNLFTKRQNFRGEYPIGVTYSKRDNKFLAQITYDNKTNTIGCFYSSTDAFYSYKKVKEKHIKDVANKYKQYIPEKLYKAMINYMVEISD